MISCLKIILFFLCLITFFSCTKKPLETVEGTATYYGNFFHGKITTSGEKYDMNEMTAAHPTFPFGTKVKVINKENNKSVIVEINDRPLTNKKSRIDLSKGAFSVICDLDSGVVPVVMEVTEWGKKE
jgi:rare lipoprotein A